MRIVLASASPRRRELIKKLDGVQADICPADIDEDIAESDPVKLVTRLALMKARAVYSSRGGIVVGADTVVCLDGTVLGKPHDADTAREYLSLLSGRTHSVLTGLAVIGGGKEISAYARTDVTFAALPREVIERYIADGSPLDKAGAYGAQDEIIAPYIERIEGDRDNVIGLPVELLGKTLEENFGYGCNGRSD